MGSKKRVRNEEQLRLEAESQQARRKRGLEPDDERHGTASGYQAWGCRCAPCTEAHAAYHRVRKGGTAPKNKTPKYATKTSHGNGLAYRLRQKGSHEWTKGL